MPLTTDIYHWSFLRAVIFWMVANTTVGGRLGISSISTILIYESSVSCFSAKLIYPFLFGTVQYHKPSARYALILGQQQALSRQWFIPIQCKKYRDIIQISSRMPKRSVFQINFDSHKRRTWTSEKALIDFY